MEAVSSIKAPTKTPHGTDVKKKMHQSNEGPDLTLRASTGLALTIVIPIVVAAIALVSSDYEAKAEMNRTLQERYVTKETLAAQVSAQKALADARYEQLSRSMNRLEDKIDSLLKK